MYDVDCVDGVGDCSGDVDNGEIVLVLDDPAVVVLEDGEDDKNK